MSTEPPYSENGGSDGGGSGEGRPQSGIAPVRAFVVLVLFVVAAIALVAVGTRPSVSGDAATPPTTTSTTTPHKTTAPTTTTTTVPHSSVTVVVANATQTNGLAAKYTTTLAAQGWAMQTATDAATSEVTSSVYYAAGEQVAAASIATTLGLKPTVVSPLTAAVPVSGVSGFDVVVVIGSDLVPAAS
jgi:hypothetical protein